MVGAEEKRWMTCRSSCNVSVTRWKPLSDDPTGFFWVVRLLFQLSFSFVRFFQTAKRNRYTCNQSIVNLSPLLLCSPRFVTVQKKRNGWDVMPSDSLRGGRESLYLFWVCFYFVCQTLGKLAILSYWWVVLIFLFLLWSFRRSTHLGSFAVVYAGRHSVSDAVRPASFPSGPRRSRPKFLPKPAPDLRLLPSRIQRSPIRCKFSHLFPSFFFLLVSWLAYEIIESPPGGNRNNKSLPLFFPPF